MNLVEHSDAIYPAAARTPRGWWLRLRRLIWAIITAQYTILAVTIGASLAATLRYMVTPQIVAQFEAIIAALKH